MRIYPDITYLSDFDVNFNVNKGILQEVTVMGMVMTSNGYTPSSFICTNPPSVALDILSLPHIEYEDFLDDVQCGTIVEVCVITPITENTSINLSHSVESSTEYLAAIASETKATRFEAQGWEALRDNPYYDLLREYEDIFPEEIPPCLPTEKGIRHEIDLVPGTKYCVTRQ